MPVKTAELKFKSRCCCCCLLLALDEPGVCDVRPLLPASYRTWQAGLLLRLLRPCVTPYVLRVAAETTRTSCAQQTRGDGCGRG